MKLIKVLASEARREDVPEDQVQEAADIMAELAAETAQMDFHLEQVQDFTPTPMTTSSVMFWTGLDPRTMKPVFVERDPKEKKAQKNFFFMK